MTEVVGKYKPDNFLISVPSIKYIIKDEKAIAPKKANYSDIGYDIWIIKPLEGGSKSENGVEYYDTGLVVQPPDGYYFELFPRSSISKTGYMLANGIGLIDPDYRGNLIVALRNISSDKKLTLPLKICQLVPKKIVDSSWKDPIEVKELSKTKRGSGGFGSTDKE